MPVAKVQLPDGRVARFEVPEGTTPEQVTQEVTRLLGGQEPAPQEQPSDMGVGKQALRAGEFASRGFLERGADILGAVPELAASGLRMISPSLAPEPGYYPEAIKSGLQTAGRAMSAPLNAAIDFGPATPQSGLERGAYGAGAGVADVGAFLVPGAAVGRMAQAGSLPARVGQAMTAQPVMQTAAGALGGGVSEAADSEALGLAASLALPIGAGVARRAITPFPSQLSPNEQRLAAAAEQAGIQLTPGQKTGSAPLRTMESVFTQTPFTGKAQGEIYSGQHRAFNRAVLSKVGIDADEASPEVMSKAYQSIGREMDDLASKTDVKIDQAFVDGFKRIEDDFSTYFGADASTRFQQVKNKLGQLIEAHKDPKTFSVNIPGEEYQKAMSKIKSIARKTSDPFEKEGLIELERLVNDAVGRSAGESIRGAWRDANNRYRNLMIIDKAMQGGSQASRAAADIPFGPLKTAVAQSDKGGYTRGRGDLNELSRVGDFLGSAIPPDSGTARRSLMQYLLTGGGAGAGGGYMAVGGDPVSAALIAGGALAGPKIAQTAYQIPMVQRYLTNQSLPQGRLSRELIGNIIAAQQLGYGAQ